MAPVTALDAFPRRPIAVRAGWRTVLATAGSALVALATLAGGIWFAAVFGPSLLRDPQVWREGRPATITDMAGSCTTRLSWLPFSWCSLDVSYLGTAGQVLKRSVSALTFIDFDRSAPPSLKVDPNDENTVALSWFADDLPLRWSALVTAAGGLIFLAGVIGAGVWALLREFRLYRALALEPNPVAARILAVRLVSNPGWAREVSFRAEDQL